MRKTKSYKAVEKEIYKAEKVFHEHSDKYNYK